MATRKVLWLGGGGHGVGGQYQSWLRSDGACETEHKPGGESAWRPSAVNPPPLVLERLRTYPLNERKDYLDA